MIIIHDNNNKTIKQWENDNNNERDDNDNENETMTRISKQLDKEVTRQWTIRQQNNKTMYNEH